MKKVKVNIYKYWAYLYFFFNSLGLKGGLLYTNLLTPVLYFWLLKKTKQPVILPFLLVVIPFDIIHLINGVDITSFVLSNCLFLSTYIFVKACQYFVINYNLQIIFKELLLANFVFVIFSCILYFTPFKESLWYTNKFTKDIDNFTRLALFTFESSYYALLFAPIAIYYLLKTFLGLTSQSFYIIVLTIIPLVLSLSIGVLGAIILSFFCLYLLNWKKVFYKKSYFKAIFWGISILFCSCCIMVIFFPHNAFLIRLNNILNGADSSTKGRTVDSFMMAWMVAEEKSIWFGSGLGQIKILAYDIVKKNFNYWGDLEVVRIPNAVAETLAIFGIFGLIIRFGLIFYLFFKTKVLSNYYRTCLFLFIFIYQFTGSYITNIVEYVIWVLAFSDIFKHFNVKANTLD
ncbi:MAG: hypothetical protein V4620_10505 [Bacteroidota bacterium]